MIDLAHLSLRRLQQFYLAYRAGWPARTTGKYPDVVRANLRRQFSELEGELGVPLFCRRIHQLTEDGLKVIAAVESLCQNLQNVQEGSRQRSTITHLHLGVSSVVAHHYLPRVLFNLRRRFSDWVVTCRDGSEEKLESWLQDGSIQIAITPLGDERPPGCQSKRLLSLPLVLLVPQQMKVRSASELKKKLNQPLLCLESSSAISRCFVAGLRQHQLAETQRWTASSIESIELSVQKRLGLGVSVAMPGRKLPAGLRALSLPGFPTVDVGVLWREPLTAAIESLIEQLENETKRLRAQI